MKDSDFHLRCSSMSSEAINKAGNVSPAQRPGTHHPSQKRSARMFAHNMNHTRPNTCASRRGTVLLLVLGALAMVLILSVVYAALGRGDRRTSQTVVKRFDTQQSINGVGNHVLDTIANDVFDLVPDVAMEDALIALGETGPIMRRETIDLPYTDFFYLSVPSEEMGDPADQTAIDALRFRPSGGHSADAVWDRAFVAESSLQNLTSITKDPRVASDPWLASTRPVDLGYENFTSTYEPFEYQRDWLQISNFAPDGRFVNLFYLRADEDGFDAPSIDLTRDPNGNNARLSLLDSNGLPTTALPYSDMLSTGSAVQADWNRPAHWTMYQRALFRPINDPDFDGSALGDPGDPDYWAYQYADADGDGMLDSRWIELVDAADETRPTALLGDSEYRFFAAIRAIDLSSLVNVTTATDFLTPPSTTNRLGQGPHEINLFKLLHQTEHYYAHSNGNELGLHDVFNTGTGQAGDYGLYDLETARLFGRKANLRVKDGAGSGNVRRYGLVPNEDNPTNALSSDLDDYTLFDNAEERANYAAAVGVIHPGANAGGNSRAPTFGIDDLVELLTFHGVNDDTNFSNLEKAFASDNTQDVPFSLSLLRSDKATASDAWPDDTSDYNRLKRARAALDTRRMLTTVSGHRPLRSSILETAQYAGLTDSTDRKALLNTLVLDDGVYPNDDEGDTIDDYREEQYDLVQNAFAIYMDVLAPHLRQDDWDRSDTQRFETTKTQYYGHMGPELAVRLAGHMALNFRDYADTPVIDVLSGVSNGVPDVGNILGLDLTDPATLQAYQRRQEIPTPAVLRLSDVWMPGSGATGLMEEMWNAGMRLDVEEIYRGEGYDETDPRHIALSGAQNVSHDAMILYGVEPQPFLSQVASMTMYADKAKDFADRLNGGANPDGEWDQSTINSGAGPDGIAGNADDWDGLPNINGDASDAANEDFLFQALFFQLFNPYDTPIVLDRYYLEFADNFYSFVDGTGTSLVLPPRSTVVFWTSNPGDPMEIDNRLSNLGITFGAFGSGSSAFEAMIEDQVGANVPVQQLAKRFGNPPGLGVPNTYREVLPADIADLFYLDPAAQSEVNRVVMLWRDMPQTDDPTQGWLNWAQNTISINDRTTDMLVDRLRDTSTVSAAPARSGPVGSGGSGYRAVLDRRLALPPLDGPNGEVTVNNALSGDAGHRAGPDFLDFPNAINYNSEGQIGVALWGSISRQDDARYDSGSSAVSYYTGNTTGGPNGDVNVTGTPVGALSAKVFESTIQNPGSYSVANRPIFLSNETQATGSNVAGTGASRMFPEGLDLEADVDGSDPILGTDLAEREVANLWQNLAGGPRGGITIRPRFFQALGTPVLTRDTTVDLMANIDPSQVTDFGEYAGKTYVTATFNQNEFRDILTGRQTLRVGDMLLPLAVGAYRTPLETGPNGEPASPDGLYSTNPILRLYQYEAQWTTLGEALAAAMGYADAVGPATSRAMGNPDLDDPFASLSFDKSSGAPIVKNDDYVLDRGHLRLDAFPAFLDLGPGGPNGDYDANSDILRGLGIPMALSIFDIAQAGSELGLASMGGIDRPVMGTINTNTADPEVLRLSPAFGNDAFATANATAADRLWWPETLRQTAENDVAYHMNIFEDNSPTGARPPVAVDVGGTIADYRDAARYAYFNPGPVTSGGGPGGSLPMEEIDDTPLDYAIPGTQELGLRIDRTTNSGIDVIREQPGIGSIGELFAARNPNTSITNTQHFMDTFARDGRSEGVGFIDRRAPNNNDNYGRGMAPPLEPDQMVANGDLAMEIATYGGQLTGDLIGASYASRLLQNPALLEPLREIFPGASSPTLGGPNGLLPLMPDQVPDDYDEQLIQLNAVLNSMSTGSDYYAVWMLIHGYREVDTEGLSADEPLTPSFKGRYLMIVDRSNVTRKGQRPRVLAFVQVPETLPPRSLAGN